MHVGRTKQKKQVMTTETASARNKQPQTWITSNKTTKSNADESEITHESKGDVLATSPYIRLSTPTRKTLAHANNAHGTQETLHVLAQEQTMPNESHTREKPRISRPDIWNAFCYLPYWELPNKSLLYSTLHTHTHTHTHFVVLGRRLHDGQQKN